MHPGALAAVKWQTGNTERCWILSHSTGQPCCDPPTAVSTPSSLTLHCNEHGVCIAIHGLLGVQPQERQGGAKRRERGEQEKRCTRTGTWCSMRVHGMRQLRVANKSKNVHNSCYTHYGTPKEETFKVHVRWCPANGRPSDGTNNTLGKTEAKLVGRCVGA